MASVIIYVWTTRASKEREMEDLLEWTEKQVSDLEQAVWDVLDERGKPHSDEIDFLITWRGQPIELRYVLDEVVYATAEVDEADREWLSLTDDEKKLVREKFVP
jgi:hypothetical protein